MSHFCKYGIFRIRLIRIFNNLFFNKGIPPYFWIYNNFMNYLVFTDDLKIISKNKSFRTFVTVGCHILGLLRMRMLLSR